jgi:DNA-binding LacI/PurR family transcriptional regulator
MPCIVLNNILDEPINYVAVDNRSAAFGAVKHLMKQGHRQIATIAGDVSTQAGLRRLDGYREALHEENINISRSYVTFGEFLRTPARAAARKLLKLRNRPTAIFVASDVMALEAIDVAKSLGIRVPQDLSIVGFDNNPLGMMGSVNLTTVSQPLVEMGRLGAENLYQISRGKIQLPVKVVLPTKLVKRQSVNAVAAA